MYAVSCILLILLFTNVALALPPVPKKRTAAPRPSAIGESVHQLRGIHHGGAEHNVGAEASSQETSSHVSAPSAGKPSVIISSLTQTLGDQLQSTHLTSSVSETMIYRAHYFPSNGLAARETKSESAAKNLSICSLKMYPLDVNASSRISKTVRSPEFEYYISMNRGHNDFPSSMQKNSVHVAKNLLENFKLTNLEGEKRFVSTLAFSHAKVRSGVLFLSIVVRPELRNHHLHSVSVHMDSTPLGEMSSDPATGELHIKRLLFFDLECQGSRSIYRMFTIVMNMDDVNDEDKIYADLILRGLNMRDFQPHIISRQPQSLTWVGAHAIRSYDTMLLNWISHAELIAKKSSEHPQIGLFLWLELFVMGDILIDLSLSKFTHRTGRQAFCYAIGTNSAIPSLSYIFKFKQALHLTPFAQVGLKGFKFRAKCPPSMFLFFGCLVNNEQTVTFSHLRIQHFYNVHPRVVKVIYNEENVRPSLTNTDLANLYTDQTVLKSSLMGRLQRRVLQPNVDIKVCTTQQWNLKVAKSSGLQLRLMNQQSCVEVVLSEEFTREPYLVLVAFPNRNRDESDNLPLSALAVTMKCRIPGMFVSAMLLHQTPDFTKIISSVQDFDTAHNFYHFALLSEANNTLTIPTALQHSVFYVYKITILPQIFLNLRLLKNFSQPLAKVCFP